MKKQGGYHAWTLRLPSQTGRKFDLVSLGECMVELWSDEPLGTARTLRRSYGGDALNALVAASRLGSRTAFITRVGDDPFGEGLVENWRSEGVETSCARLVRGTNGVYFISIQPNGEREFSYRRAGSAAARIKLDDEDRACIKNTRILLVSGITQAISVEGERATLEAASLARAAGAVVAFDPNYRPGLWSDREAGNAEAGARAARDAFDSVLDYVDVFLPSIPSDSPLWSGQDDAVDALRRLADSRGIGLIAAKAGADGAFLIGASGHRHVGIDEPVDALDTTGAGDAWNGAFLHHVGVGHGVQAAATAAHHVARWILLNRGAISPAV